MSGTQRYLLEIWGMTRDHPFATPPKPQHPLHHCGLAAVQATQKYSHVAVTKPACLPIISPSPFLYRRPWCIKSACPRHFYTEVPALVLTYRFLYTLFCASPGPPLALVRGVVAL